MKKVLVYSNEGKNETPLANDIYCYQLLDIFTAKRSEGYDRDYLFYHADYLHDCGYLESDLYYAPIGYDKNKDWQRYAVYTPEGTCKDPSGDFIDKAILFNIVYARTKRDAIDIVWRSSIRVREEIDPYSTLRYEGFHKDKLETIPICRWKTWCTSFQQ